MKSEEKFHVLGLKPKEQLALRGLLFNSFSGWIHKVILESEDYSEKQRETKATYTYRVFCRYNDLTDLLATENNVHKTKPTCLILSEEGIKLISFAVAAFDEKNNFIGSTNIGQVVPYFSKIKKKVEQSMLFSYTKQEIERVKNEP